MRKGKEKRVNSHYHYLYEELDKTEEWDKGMAEYLEWY